MNFSLVSDVHLEFTKDELFFKNYHNTDVLVIAGDLAELKNFEKFEPIFKFISNEFKHVLIIPGNHEFYFNDVFYGIKQFHDFVERFDNFHSLVNNDFLYKGFRFTGDTFWTNFNACDVQAVFTAKARMNDFRLIKQMGNLLTPYMVANIHYSQFDRIKDSIYESKEPVIVVTHHAPSLQSISTEYINGGNFNLNYAYASNYDEFILNNPNIKVWVHGHVHDEFDYMIGDTRIVAHPRGYDEYDYFPKLIEINN